ncbi:ABC-type sugar transport system permease subunit [Anaerotaenia torta]|uniref:carbohydrate ABC transporter permease n=1 Tax=Anaerotaenia torta TaxID=433293 RepID=UPI003D2525AD
MKAKAITKKRRRTSLSRKQGRAGYLFVFPWVIGFLFFFLKPFLESFWFTFNDVTMQAQGLTPRFIGLDNYHYLFFEHTTYIPMLTDAVKNMLTEVVIITMLSLFIATLLNQEFRGRTFYRAVFFLPIILTSGVVYTMMSSAVGSGGTASSTNAFLFQSAGLRTILLQGGLSPSLVSGITGIADSIFAQATKSGVQILLFLSGLQKIPSDSYEAAEIEGASRWDIFWKITVPRISPVIFLNIVYTIIDSFTSYGTSSGENQMMAAIQRMGFDKSMKFGVSAAMAWIYFLVIVVILLIVYLIIGKRVSKIES